jgi:hypothetical protein
MIRLNNRVHTFAHPKVKEALIDFFTHIFEVEVQTISGTSMLVFQFTDGSSYSVDFIEDALDEGRARRGAWLEVQTDDVEALEKKVRKAGYPLVDYVTGGFYFEAPSGQVWGVLPA